MYDINATNILNSTDSYIYIYIIKILTLNNFVKSVLDVHILD